MLSGIQNQSVQSPSFGSLSPKIMKSLVMKAGDDLSKLENARDLIRKADRNQSIDIFDVRTENTPYLTRYVGVDRYSGDVHKFDIPGNVAAQTDIYGVSTLKSFDFRLLPEAIKLAAKSMKSVGQEAGNLAKSIKSDTEAKKIAASPDFKKREKLFKEKTKLYLDLLDRKIQRAGKKFDSELWNKINDVDV